MTAHYNSPEEESPYLVIPIDCMGLRLDQALVRLFPEYSRACLQRWIKSGHILLAGQSVSVKCKVFGGELVSFDPPEEVEQGLVVPESGDLTRVYEDDDVLVLNKPAGLVVHPGSGNWTGTLQNRLLYAYPDLAIVPRAGLVHRLDKDTDGLMVVAKNLVSHTHLIRQLQARSVRRLYWAVVQGVMQGNITITAPIGRHVSQRTKMAVISGGREAITHVIVQEELSHYTWVQCRLETGRTHQIRVHLRHLGFPLAGDPTYGKRPVREEDHLLEVQLGRQALQAHELSFIHPKRDQEMTFCIPMAEDMAHLLQSIRNKVIGLEHCHEL